MKFLIIGDLHGRVPEIHYKRFDAIIAPGDFCSDAPRKYMFEALKQNLKDPKADVNWHDIIGKKKAKEMSEKSLADGRRILKKLNSFGVPVYIVPGNWDQTPYKESDWAYDRADNYSKLIKGLENVIDVHHELVKAEGYTFIGHGISSGPEHAVDKLGRLKPAKSKEAKKWNKKYNKDLKIVNNLFEEAESIGKPIIFMSHNVPYNTPLDKINNPASPRNGEHFGSLIARKAIERYQPLVNIGGHMHEHYRSYKFGKTLCINSGFGTKPNVFLELEGDKIKKVEFREIPNYLKYLSKA